MLLTFFVLLYAPSILIVKCRWKTTVIKYRIIAKQFVLKTKYRCLKSPNSRLMTFVHCTITNGVWSVGGPTNKLSQIQRDLFPRMKLLRIIFEHIYCRS